MLKITAIISLVLIGGVWASGLSCDSCGSECMSACGTRHFRACCFNYLRRKRGNLISDGMKMWSTKNHEEKNTIKKLPLFAIENAPEVYLSPFLMPNEFEPNAMEETERLQLIEA